MRTAVHLSENEVPTCGIKALSCPGKFRTCRCLLAKRKENTNTMKIIALIAFAGIALSFGACAKQETPAYTTTTTTAASTGYSK